MSTSLNRGGVGEGAIMSLLAVFKHGANIYSPRLA